MIKITIAALAVALSTQAASANCLSIGNYGAYSDCEQAQSQTRTIDESWGRSDHRFDGLPRENYGPITLDPASNGSDYLFQELN